MNITSEGLPGAIKQVTFDTFHVSFLFLQEKLKAMDENFNYHRLPKKSGKPW